MDEHESHIDYFKGVLIFLKEFQWLYNMPVTKILFDGSLDLLPIEWLESLKKLENNELNNFVTETNVKSNWPTSLINFIENCNKFNKLPNPSISLSSIKLPEAFMKKLSIKKQHEIYHLAQLVHEQCQLQNLSLIVDLGAGLGYICQLLNHLYNYQVLGLETKIENVEAAKKRQKTLFPDSLSSVKYVCSNVTEDSSKNIRFMLQQQFGKTENICLLGLHACADLSIHMSKIYLNMEEAQLLILVSCCYHKLTLADTKRTTVDTNEKEYFKYFPLSKTLRSTIDILKIDIGEFLRRPFMRLACQETSDRWLTMTEKAHNEHSFYVYARAILELYSYQNELYLKKLVRKGTRKSQCTDFRNYLKDCTQRYVYEKKIVSNETLATCTVSWDDELISEIIKLWEENKEKQKNIELYTALQLVLQHTSESLVLFDRLQFLKEYNCNANIIPAMDRSLSPRCYALVSTKN